MSGEFKTRDFNSWTILFALLPLSGGFADQDDAIKISQLGDDFETTEGADGSVSRSKTNKRLTEVTLAVLSTSGINDVLSTLNNIDRAGDFGAGVAPIIIKDGGGNTIFGATKAWIKGPPKDIKIGTKVVANEWVIVCANPERFDGGN